MHRNTIGIFLVIALVFITGTLSVKITNLNVPKYHVVKNPIDPEDLILDCDYQVNPQDTNLVLKWLWNDLPLYQWIVGRPPVALPFSKDKISIDTQYEASSEDNYRHRALVLTNPTWNMTGDFTCYVSTFESVDSKKAKIEIIDVSQTKIDIQKKIGEEEVEIGCNAENVSPNAKLILSVADIDQILTPSIETKKPNSNGLFDVYVKSVVSIDDIDTEADIECTLTVPGTDYSYKKVRDNSDIGDTASNNQQSIFTILIASATTILLSFMLNEGI